MSDNEVVSVKIKDNGCAIVKFQNGENRINLHFVKSFNKALDDVLSNPNSKVLITIGTGKFYSNGLDLKWMSENPDKLAEMQDLLYEQRWRISHYPLPTVAAINGHAFAGGAATALCHDYRVMNSDRGWFCWNEIEHGRRIPNDFITLIKYKMSNRMIRDAILYAKRYTGTEALSRGFVDEICKPENLLYTAEKVGLGVLWGNDFDRDTLHTMKKDLFPQILPYKPNL